MPTEEEIKEQEEEKDGEKLALGLVGAGILAAGTAVAVSKLADKGGDVRVQKHYTDITSDMNSIPIIDIDNTKKVAIMEIGIFGELSGSFGFFSFLGFGGLGGLSFLAASFSFLAASFSFLAASFAAFFSSFKRFFFSFGSSSSSGTIGFPSSS